MPVNPVNHQTKSTAVIINRALIRKTPTAATLENGWFLARHTRAKVAAATSAPSRPPKTVTTTKKISHSEVLTRLRPRVLYPESTDVAAPRSSVCIMRDLAAPPCQPNFRELR